MPFLFNETGIMKPPTLVNHPPDNYAAAGQPAGDRAYLPDRQVRIRHRGRHAAHAAWRGARLFLHARQQPDHAPARADAGGAPGTRRLPGHGLRGQLHRADADRPHQAGRSHPVFRRNLRPHAQHHPPVAVALRCRAHHAVDRRSAGHRKRARHQTYSSLDLREPDQPHHQGGRHRAAGDTRASPRRARGHGQHFCGLPPAW